MKKLIFVIMAIFFSASVADAKLGSMPNVDNPNAWVLVKSPDGKKMQVRRAVATDLDPDGKLKPGIKTIAQVDAEQELAERSEELEKLKNEALEDGITPEEQAELDDLQEEVAEVEELLAEAESSDDAVDIAEIPIGDEEIGYELAADDEELTGKEAIPQSLTTLVS